MTCVGPLIKGTADAVAVGEKYAEESAFLNCISRLCRRGNNRNALVTWTDLAPLHHYNRHECKKLVDEPTTHVCPLMPLDWW